MRIGITGGIGSGKSHVARLLQQQYGVPVYDCDSRAKALMSGSAAIRQGLERLLGRGYSKQDIADYLFASPQNAARINSIVHPAVKADFLSWAAVQPSPHVVIESAILIEAGFTDVVDRIVVVTAPVELRIARAMRRDNASREEVERRIAAQLSDASRLSHAHVVINNDGSPLCLDAVFA